MGCQATGCSNGHCLEPKHYMGHQLPPRPYVREVFRACELSALRSGEPTPDVCSCRECVKLRAEVAALDAIELA
jgi:hypothetical protein